MRHLLLAVFFLALFAFAGAIVIVPPIVYIASVSMLSLVLNLFIAFFFWVAVQGIATKSFFGKPFSAIISFAMPTAGKLFFAMALTLIFSVIIAPVSLLEMLFSAFLASIIFFLCIFLSRYRAIRNTKEKSRPISRIAIVSLLIFAISFAAILLSVEIKPVAEGTSTTGIAKDISGLPFSGSQPMGKTSPAEEAGQPLQGNEAQALWVVPTSGENCIIKAGNETLSFVPQKNCIVNAAAQEKIFCPIKILPGQIQQKGVVVITASGGCSGSIKVKVKENSFEVVFQ